MTSSAPPLTPPVPAVNMPAVQEFMGRLMGDMSSAMICLMCLIGDRLGLFKALAMQGPSTSAELARGAGVDERYAREWLSAVASAGYVGYEPVTQRFSLPPEHALALAWESSPMFMGGAYQQLAGLTEPLAEVLDAFRSGAGVPEASYGDTLRDGMERISAGWFDHLLVQSWIPCLPDVERRLLEGASVADTGCGGGRAIINLARAFPNSRFVGYDASAPVIKRATASAVAAGLADRVRFERRDVIDGLPRQYDLITAFDVLHDVREPQRFLEVVCRSLLPNGSFLIGEIKCSDELQRNAGPVGTILYGTSVLYCLPTSLANGAPGFGTLGMPESRLRALLEAAGFHEARRLPVEHPFNVLYQVRP